MIMKTQQFSAHQERLQITSTVFFSFWDFSLEELLLFFILKSLSIICPPSFQAIDAVCCRLLKAFKCQVYLFDINIAANGVRRAEWEANRKCEREKERDYVFMISRWGSRFRQMGDSTTHFCWFIHSNINRVNEEYQMNARLSKYIHRISFTVPTFIHMTDFYLKTHGFIFAQWAGISLLTAIFLFLTNYYTYWSITGEKLCCRF